MFETVEPGQTMRMANLPLIHGITQTNIPPNRFYYLGLRHGEAPKGKSNHDQIARTQVHGAAGDDLDGADLAVPGLPQRRVCVLCER